MFPAKRLLFVIHKNVLISYNANQRRFLSPLAAYNKHLDSGKLLPDEHQKNAVLELEKLYESIQNYTPKAVTSSSNGGGFFGFFSSVKDDSSSSVSSAAPKGVYLYGSVGGGKTTLMDMFFDCCDKVSFFFVVYIINYLLNLLLKSQMICIFWEKFIDTCFRNR